MSNEQQAYFVRLWNEFGDELDLEQHESEYRAWQQIEFLQWDENSIINRGGKWTHYDIVKLDRATNEEEVVDGGEL